MTKAWRMTMTLTRKLAAAALSAALVVTSWPALPALAADDNPTVESLEVGADKVIIHTTGEVSYKPIVTATPPRLILQLDGVEYHAVAKKFAGQGALIKGVRAGQFQREPLISRVVIDLNESTPYKISKTEDGLSVTLGSPTAAPKTEQAKAEAPKMEAKPEPAKPVAKAEPVKPAAPAIKPKPEVPAAPAVPAEKPAVMLAAAKIAPKDKAHDAPSDAPKKEVGGVDSRYSSELAKDAEAGSVEGERAPAAVKKEAAPVDPAAERARQSGGDLITRLPRDLVSLDFDNTDIKDVLRLMGAKAHLNLIYGGDVSGSLTLHLVDVPFNDAFRTALSMMNLVTIQVGDNILRVVPPGGARAGAQVGLSTKVVALNYQKAADIITALNAVRSAEGRSGTAIADVKTNSVIITESVEGMLSAERLIATLDARPKQVLIEAKLIEVNLSDSLNYGIQWDYLSVDSAKWNHQVGRNLVGTTISPANSGGTTRPPLDQNGTAIAGIGAGGRGTGVNLPSDKVFGALTLGRITNNYFVNATLSAAAAKGKVKVLSDPKVATLNNQAATINVTTQFPYVTSNVTATGVTSNNVQYISTGITLTVTPTINADGRITLQINPTVSQPSAVAAAAAGGAPGIDARTANTTVLVKDAETIVLGGLISDSVSNVVSKVPLLGDIPILGWLFKKKSLQRTRTELLIFVTPKILD